jgi:hypothetical protein
MYISSRDEEVIHQVVGEERVSIQAAAYTLYMALTPSNKKPILQREFHMQFVDNWLAFRALEDQESDGV